MYYFVEHSSDIAPAMGDFLGALQNVSVYDITLKASAVQEEGGQWICKLVDGVEGIASCFFVYGFQAGLWNSVFLLLSDAT
jgi:hypothetical protein